MSSIKVAAAQATPILHDRAATVNAACELIEQAGREGIELLVFPETFVPGYPDWVWRTRPWDNHHSELYALLFEQSVVVPGPDTARIADAARSAGVHVAIGVHERDPHGSTLYNSVLHFSSAGELVGKHRKLMPTGAERLVWGTGDGSSLRAVEAGPVRVGTLICWENYMPLARTALYGAGIDLYLAPTWDNSDMWVPTLRHIAREGRVFVVGVTACLRASDLPDDLPGRAELWGGEDDWLSRGNSTIVGPDGDILAGPLTGESGLLPATLDLSRTSSSRQQFDPTGHYARGDVLQLVVDRRPARSVRSEEDPVDARPRVEEPVVAPDGSGAGSVSSVPGRV